MKIIALLGLFVFVFTEILVAQVRPGFNPIEYKEMLEINSQHFDTLLGEHTLPKPTASLIFRSEEVGLDNRWDYWKTSDNIGVISIRGTTPTKVSWMENFYASMIPAIGEIVTSDSVVFKYKLAKDNRASVHAGWLLGLSFIADDINALMHSEYDKGVRSFIFVGHSQGGALSLLLRSYIEYVDDALGNKIQIKTYASAPPKPGNLYYAYDFEEINQGGWAFRIVNYDDWVPELPFAVQQVSDLNPTNPISNINKLVKNEPWYARYYIKRTIKKIENKGGDLQETYTELLGDKAFEGVIKELPNAKKPIFEDGFNYSTCGNAIVLRPTDSYVKNYVEKSDYGIFVHHHFYAYWMLINAHFPERD